MKRKPKIHKIIDYSSIESGIRFFTTECGRTNLTEELHASYLWRNVTCKNCRKRKGAK